MPENHKLHKPWLVAVWPGMGQVAIGAGFYLISKLDMRLLAEFSPPGVFEIDHVDVQDGLIRPARLPRNRFFVWHDPHQRHDIVVFIGEAQPPAGKYAFCQGLIEFAKQLGVERVFTYAAMATQMRPTQPARVFAAATAEDQLAELRRLELPAVHNGQIGGLNGVLLAVAAESGLPGTSLLGEMPQIFSQLPFPKASLAVLEVFTSLARIELDFTELQEQAKTVDEQLERLLAQVEETLGRDSEPEEESYAVEEEEEPGPPPEDLQRIEKLFDQARQNRKQAYELKAVLDRVGVFKEYEDRFLDLFKTANSTS